MIDSQPPRAGGSSARPPDASRRSSLNIIVIDKGFIVSAFGQRIGEGCQGPGSGVAVGMKTADGAKDYDYASLTACAKRLKNQVPEAADETSADASPRTRTSPTRSIIGTCDAIRKADDGQVLFPDITFGVPK